VVTHPGPSSPDPTHTDPAQRLAELEVKVDGLVQLVEHLYHQLGISAPGYRPPAAAAHPPAVDPEILQAIADGNMIQAIKVYRERTGVGLKEAKDAVEALAGRR
jgi:ribosomal protein L7/L12